MGPEEHLLQDFRQGESWFARFPSGERIRASLNEWKPVHDEWSHMILFGRNEGRNGEIRDASRGPKVNGRIEPRNARDWRGKEANGASQNGSGSGEGSASYQSLARHPLS